MLRNFQQRFHQGTSSVHEVVLIFIITLRILVNCDEIGSSTVRNGITDAGFLAPTDYVSKYSDISVSSETSTDACKIDQTLVISNNPVRLKAFTGSQLCSILVTTNNRVGISVSVLHSEFKSTYSYFFIEVLGNEIQHCADQYLLVQDDNIPCITKIKGNHFRFSLQNIAMILEVHAEDHDMTECFQGLSELSDTIASCKTTRYQNQVRQKQEHVSYPSSISFNVTRYFVDSECKCSSQPCGCVLGYREWYYSDNNNMGNKREVHLIHYRNWVEGLSFANTTLGTIVPGAFYGLDSLKYLILHQNNIRALPVNVFVHTLKLEVLDLSYNYI